MRGDDLDIVINTAERLLVSTAVVLEWVACAGAFQMGMLLDDIYWGFGEDAQHLPGYQL